MCNCGNYKDGKCTVNGKEIEPLNDQFSVIPAWCPVTTCSVNDPVAYANAVMHTNPSKTSILDVLRVE